MATCVICRKYVHERTDRYCGFCGAPLTQLVIADGGQVSLPTDAQGKLQVALKVENRGWADLRFQLQEPSHGAVRVLSAAGEVLLRPLDTPTEIQLEIDADKLGTSHTDVVRIPFASDDATLPTGFVRVLRATPGEIEVGVSEVNLGPIPTTAGARVQFTVSLRNTGGARIRIIIPPHSPDQIDVAFASGSAVWVDGFSSSEILLNAWLTGKRVTGRVEDVLELAFSPVREGARQQANVRLSGECFTPPQARCGTLDFGARVPRENCCGLLPVFSEGSVPLTITEVQTDDPCIRLLTPLPMQISGDARGDALEFMFTTRFREAALPDEQRSELRGCVLLRTDSPTQPYVAADWRVELYNPPVDEIGTLALDFGTVNSCVAYDGGHGRPDPVPIGDDGKAIIPSLLAFLGEDLAMIGRRAETEALIRPGNVVHSIKRCLVEGERTFFGRTYKSVDLAALIIEQLLLRACRVLGVRPRNIQMTVPASYWGPRRDAMVDACRRAWQDHETIEVLDEPTACALNYVFLHPDEFKDLGRLERILVFDFGGGTLDISIVELRTGDGGRRIVQPVVTRGEGLLGGVDLDLVTLRYLADAASSQVDDFAADAIKESRRQFERRQLPHEGVSILRHVRYDWITKARRIKEELSSNVAATFAVDELYDMHGRPVGDGSGTGFRYELRALDFVNCVINRAIDTAEELVRLTLTAAGMSPDDINVVLLAGQTSRIPAIRRRISGLFPDARVPDLGSFDLKESVACGAALAAYYLNSPDAPWQPLGLDVTSYSYGILQLDRAGTRREFRPIIQQLSPFDAAPEPITIRAKPGNHIEVVQYNGVEGQANDHMLIEPWTALGYVKVPRRSAGEVNEHRFSLRFSPRDERLLAELDGELVDLVPVDEDALERMYL